MKRIAFIGHDLKFINHIIDFLNNKHGFEVRKDEWTGHETPPNENKSLEIIEWADILFCEWGLGNVVWYQERKKEHQKLFVRLHRFEMNTKYPKLFDYDKIDKLIAISPYIFEEFHRVAKVPREKMTVIFNAVDTERFNVDKNDDVKFNLGIIGIVPKLKRLDRALELFEALYQKDNRYKLFVKGKHPKEYGWVWNNEVERAHYDAIFDKIENSAYKHNIIFEGWGDVADWLKNVGYVLSVSDYESFHMAPIEGMSSGAYPVVLRREGVNTIFPKKYIFESLSEMGSFISNGDKKEDPTNLKEFVKRNYSLEQVCNQLNLLLTK